MEDIQMSDKKLKPKNGKKQSHHPPVKRSFPYVPAAIGLFIVLYLFGQLILVGIAIFVVGLILKKVKPDLFDKTYGVMMDALCLNRAPKFKLNAPIMIGENEISENPRSKKINGVLVHSFKCRINPTQAKIDPDSFYENQDNDQLVDIKVPSKNIIRKMMIGVDRENKVQWVYVGGQPHPNKEESSGCVLLKDNVFLKVLSEEVLINVIDILKVYDYREGKILSSSHHTDEFRKSNSNLFKEIEDQRQNALQKVA
jgi:hypothetical protein